MPEFIDTCPLCQFGQHRQFAITQFRGLRVENWICNRCGFVFQNPRMTEEEKDAFYARSYRQVYQGYNGPTEKDLVIQGERAKTLLEVVKRLISTVNVHLDIGCSAGLLIEAFQKALNCRSIGVEPGDTYRIYSQEKGFKVHTDLEDLQRDGTVQFDLISMIHVLEHIPNPVTYLTELRQQYLHPNGHVLLEVPNLFCHDSFEIAHMSSFSQHTLAETLQQSGFSIVALKTQGSPRSKVLPLYLTVLAQPDKNRTNYNVKPENWVLQKRELGMFYRRVIQRLLPKIAWVDFKSLSVIL